MTFLFFFFAVKNVVFFLGCMCRHPPKVPSHFVFFLSLTEGEKGGFFFLCSVEGEEGRDEM